MIFNAHFIIITIIITKRDICKVYKVKEYEL